MRPGAARYLHGWQAMQEALGTLKEDLSLCWGGRRLAARPRPGAQSRGALAEVGGQEEMRRGSEPVPGAVTGVSG